MAANNYGNNTGPGVSTSPELNPGPRLHHPLPLETLRAKQLDPAMTPLATRGAQKVEVAATERWGLWPEACWMRRRAGVVAPPRACHSPAPAQRVLRASQVPRQWAAEAAKGVAGRTMRRAPIRSHKEQRNGHKQRTLHG